MARSKPPLFRDVPKVRPAMVAPPDAPRGQRPDNRGVRPAMVAPPPAPRGPRPDNSGVRPAMMPVSTIANRAMDWAGIRR